MKDVSVSFVTISVIVGVSGFISIVWPKLEITGSSSIFSFVVCSWFSVVSSSFSGFKEAALSLTSLNF